MFSPLHPFYVPLANNQRNETITRTFCSCSTFSLWAACQWLNKCPLLLSDWHFLSVSSINSLPKKQCWFSFKVIPPTTNRERFCVTYDKIKVKWEIPEIFTLCYSKEKNVNSQKSKACKFHGAYGWYSLLGRSSAQFEAEVQRFGNNHDILHGLSFVLLNDVTDRQRRSVLFMLISNKFAT